MSAVIVEQAPSPISGKETRTTFVLGFGFFCVFSSFMALQNLQGSLNDEGGLGVISLGCLYAGAILSAIYAPTLLTVIGVKRTMMLAFFGHLIYISANFYPSFNTLIPSSVILGSVTGPLWTSSGTYLTTCAFSSAESSKVDIYSTLSKVNGIFFTMFEVSNIVGNLLSSLVLYQGKYNGTYTNGSTLCGPIDCPREETIDSIEDPDLVVVYTLLGIFLGSVSVGFVTITICLPPLNNQVSLRAEDIKRSLGSWFRLIYRTDIKFLLPLFIYIALEQQIAFTEITKSFVSCPIGIQNVGYVMTAYGASSTLSTFIFSRVARYTRRYVLIGSSSLLQMSVMVWMYHWIPLSSDFIKIFLLASLWGVAEGIWKTQTNVILGDLFCDNKQEAFAVYEGIKSFCFTVTFSYSSFLCTYIKLLIAMGMLTIAITLYAFVEIKSVKKKSKTGPQNLTQTGKVDNGKN